MEKNSFKITKHVIDGDSIVFYHYDRDFDLTTHSFTEWEEREWFRLRVATEDKSVSLSSNARITFATNKKGGLGGCSEGEIMRYFKNNHIGKLVKSEVLPLYDENPYGRSVFIGSYVYEVYDLSDVI